MSDVMFRRIHGRIVPVQRPRTEQASAFLDPKAIAAGVAAGTATAGAVFAGSGKVANEFRKTAKTWKLERLVANLKSAPTKIIEPKTIFEYANADRVNKAAEIARSRFARFSPLLAQHHSILNSIRRFTPVAAIGLGLGAAGLAYLGRVAYKQRTDNR